MKRNKYIPHCGIKELAKKLTKVLVKACEGKPPEERVVLEKEFLDKITLATQSGNLKEIRDAAQDLETKS